MLLEFDLNNDFFPRSSTSKVSIYQKKIGLLLLKILRKKLFSFRSGLTEGFGPSLKNF